MSLKDGYTDVPPGKIASVVTHLEMRAAPAPRPEVDLERTELRRVPSPSVDWYRALFRAVGGEDWLWFSRLVLDDAALARVIGHSDVEIYSLVSDGHDRGLLELDFRERGACELAFLGVTRSLVGSGVGRFIMNRAIERAWSRDIDRFRVHTCTLDHPGALGFYLRSGFSPVRQQVEVSDDPRILGLLPETAAPHVPIIR